MNRGRWLILGVVAALLLAPLYAVAAGTVLTNVERMSLTDSSLRNPGDVVRMFGWAGDPAVGNPPGVVFQSEMPDRGTLVIVRANGTPGQDSDQCVIVEGQGRTLDEGPYLGIMTCFNYGPDGLPQRAYIGTWSEDGGAGVPVCLIVGDPTANYCYIVGKPGGWAEVYTGIRAVDNNGNPMVEMYQGGLRLRKPDGTMGLVELGPPDSGGTGYRALRMPN